MGGNNSGRHGGKRTTNRMNQLDIRRVHRSGGLALGDSSVWSWTSAAGNVASICIDAGIDGVTLTQRVKNTVGEWQDFRCQVAVEWTPCNYGGQRPWWGCPGCTRRVAILYAGRQYACRHCHDLTYKSTRTGANSKFFARANKVRRQLGWGGGVASPPGERPKGMHLATYLRLLRQLNAHSIAALASTDAMVDRMQSKLGSIKAV